jgi:hypothetical protein
LSSILKKLQIEFYSQKITDWVLFSKDYRLSSILKKLQI